MRTAKGTRPLGTPDDDRTEARWRLGFLIVLSCAIFAAVAAFMQPPTKVSIRQTGPMPGVSVP
ncbi:hypothetical protein ACVILL_002598 [Bradyrhizobium sp. USDA 3364]